MRYLDLFENRIFNFDKWFEQFMQNFALNGYPSNNTIVGFFKKIVKNIIIINNTKVDVDYLSKNKPTEWDRVDYKKGILIRPYINIDQLNKLNHIIDWLNNLPPNQYQSLRGIQNLDIAYEHANRYFAAKNKKATNLEDEEGREIVYTFPDGMFFAKLNSSQCLDREGKLMQHCVGSYAERVKEGNVVIYSLRDKKNQPHATLEVRGKSIYQIKGKQNEAPVEKYIPYIREFILKNNFDVLRDIQNIGLIRLNDKLYDTYRPDTWPKTIVHPFYIDLPKNISSLPNGLTIRNLNLEKTAITQLPETLTTDSLILNKNISSIPEKVFFNSLTAPGLTEFSNSQLRSIIILDDLNISNSTVSKLPNIRSINKDLNLFNCNNLKELPSSLGLVRGMLNISNTNITYLPENISVGQLNGWKSKLKTLPHGIDIKLNCFLEQSEIEWLPDNLKIAENLELVGCKNLKKLPENLSVGTLAIEESNIRNIPNTLKCNILTIYDINDNSGKYIFPKNKIANVIIISKFQEYYKQLYPSQNFVDKFNR